MAFKCLICGIYQGSKARYKGGSVCKRCTALNKLEKRIYEQ